VSFTHPLCVCVCVCVWCECVCVCVCVALGIQHAMRIRRIICGLPHSTTFFPHYLINGTIFERKKKVLEHKMCVISFSTNFDWNYLILRRNERDVIKKMYFGLHVKYPIFLSCFNETWFFSSDFLENLQISNFMKIRPVGAEYFHASGRTDRHDEANSRFSEFCEGA